MKLRELYLTNTRWTPETIVEVTVISEYATDERCKGELNDIIKTYCNYDVYGFGNNFVYLINDTRINKED